MRKYNVNFLLIIGILLSYSSLQATVVYSDKAAWIAVQPSYLTATIPDCEMYQYFGAGGAAVTYDEVQFSELSLMGDSLFYLIGSSWSGAAPVLSAQHQTTGLVNIAIVFPFPVVSAGLNFSTFGDSAVNFALSNGTFWNVWSDTRGGYTAPNFAGVVDTNPFTTLLLTTPDTVLSIRSIVFSAPADEPAFVPTSEPMPFGLMGLGLAALGVYRSRSQK